MRHAKLETTLGYMEDGELFGRTRAGASCEHCDPHAGRRGSRGRPTPKQWVRALALVAKAEPFPGVWREIEFTPGGAVRIHEHPLPPGDADAARTSA